MKKYKNTVLMYCATISEACAWINILKQEGYTGTLTTEDDWLGDGFTTIMSRTNGDYMVVQNKNYPEFYRADIFYFQADNSLAIDKIKELDEIIEIKEDGVSVKPKNKVLVVENTVNRIGKEIANLDNIMVDETPENNFVITPRVDYGFTPPPTRADRRKAARKNKR